MSRVVVTTGLTLPASGGTPAFTIPRGAVLEVTAAQATAITNAGGSTRAVATSTAHDQLGESAGISNGN